MTDREYYKAGRHCVFELDVHLVFVTKCRRDVLTSEHLDFYFPED